MLRQYEGELGIFEYDDAECSVGHSIEGEDRLFWLGTSKSVTVTGILRSTRRMFADATLPAGFKLAVMFYWNMSMVLNVSFHRMWIKF